ncbi:M48 family metallopeptidase [bacterium]|nr:M48 family metallopeptidase [bacterium]
MKTQRSITYAVQRSRRKTVSIYVERDGTVTVLVPEQLTDQEVERLVEAKRGWIHRSLAEWRALNTTRVVREFVNGEGFLYLGRSYRLQLTEAQEQPLLLKDGHFCLRAEQQAEPQARKAFREFYREKGLKWIGERIAFYERRIGVRAGGLRVLDLKSRWASCAKAGVLNFHWKCMMAPLRILDYIVVHELVHLLHPTHSRAFWSEIDKVIPDYRERMEWLRVNGAGLDL